MLQKYALSLVPWAPSLGCMSANLKSMTLSTIIYGVYYVPWTIPGALQKEIPLDNNKVYSWWSRKAETIVSMVSFIYKVRKRINSWVMVLLT